MAPRKPTTRAGAEPAATTRRSARLEKQAPALAPVPDEQHRITKTKAAPKPKPKYDCTTCGRNLAASAFPTYAITDSCDHLINTCKACLKEWVAAQLKMTTYDKLSCPQCPSIMKNEDVQRAAARDVYQRFDEIERRSIAEKVPGWRWCMSPKCRSGQVHEPLVKNPDLAKPKLHVMIMEEESEDDIAVVSPEAWNKVKQAAKEANTIDLEAMDEERLTAAKTGKRLLRQRKTSLLREAISAKGPLSKVDSLTICTCDTCGASACVTCDRPYHEGETCAQYQRRRRRQTEVEDKASERFISKECKQCPKCKKNIEKRGGCDMVTCTQCYTGVCWLCELDYVDIRKTGHGQGCAYARQGAVDPHNMPAGGGPNIWQPVAVGGGAADRNFFANLGNALVGAWNGGNWGGGAGGPNANAARDGNAGNANP